MRNIGIYTVYGDIDGTGFSNNYLKNGEEPLTGVRIDVVGLKKVQNNHGLPFPGSPLFFNNP